MHPADAYRFQPEKAASTGSSGPIPGRKKKAAPKKAAKSATKKAAKKAARKAARKSSKL
jgi:hypothetical protein